ncbi:hypothetical protein QTP88_010358 [Uroleucon formosanum]
MCGTNFFSLYCIVQVQGPHTIFSIRAPQSLVAALDFEAYSKRGCVTNINVEDISMDINAAEQSSKIKANNVLNSAVSYKHFGLSMIFENKKLYGTRDLSSINIDIRYFENNLQDIYMCSDCQGLVTDRNLQRKKARIVSKCKIIESLKSKTQKMEESLFHRYELPIVYLADNIKEEEKNNCTILIVKSNIIEVYNKLYFKP